MFDFDLKYEDFVWGDKFSQLSNIKFLKIDDAFSFIQSNTSDVNIVSHNGDYPIDGKFENYQNNFPRWYGQNIVTGCNKFKPIPIGLENDYVANSVEKKHMLLNLSNSSKSVRPNKMLYINHNIGTNSHERQAPYNIFSNSSWCTVEHSGGFSYQSIYYSKILDHTFMLSPPGNGIDCHRTWEILYLRRIPVLKKVGRLQELYSELPVVFIDSYDQLNESFLRQELNSLSNKTFNFEKLKFSYWKSLVQS